MSDIHVLSKNISELIAAGEVIERPSSVIKELVENSIDAGANVITVEIKNGGSTYMRVTDNGKGIQPEDVKIAFLRHATSKISSKSDLDKIMTLGFRGEALASICAVSRVDILTKTQDSEYGVHYSMEGTEEKIFEKSGCPDGTTIVIRDLFFNVPARLKFLKKPVTEGNAISAIISKIALSHPEISFKFIRDNKIELISPGDGKLYSSIFSIFGKEFASSLMPVDYEYNNIHVSGFIAKPLHARANRSFQNFFVNKRFVKSMTCTVSFEEAYKNSIMTGKFPACVLMIDISPEIVDVNVHPAKIEVRFSNEKLVFDSIYFAVKNSLMNNDMPTEVSMNTKPSISINTIKPSNDESFSAVKQHTFTGDNMAFSSITKPYMENTQSKFSDNEEKYQNEYEKNLQSEQILNINSDDIETKKIDDVSNEKVETKAFKFINENSFQKKSAEVNPVEIPSKPSIKLIGEIFSTYIIAEQGDEMILIDKHAAHERLIFEKIKKQGYQVDIQYLLQPIEITSSVEEYNILSENNDVLLKSGFSIEFCSDNLLKVKGIPVFINENDTMDFISEIAGKLINNDSSTDGLYDDLFHSIACRAAIKANDKTYSSELLALINQIIDEDIRYCPHGRPVLIVYKKKEIEKQFKRIM